MGKWILSWRADFKLKEFLVVFCSFFNIFMFFLLLFCCCCFCFCFFVVFLVFFPSLLFLFCCFLFFVALTFSCFLFVVFNMFTCSLFQFFLFINWFLYVVICVSFLLCFIFYFVILYYVSFVILLLFFTTAQFIGTISDFELELIHQFELLNCWRWGHCGSSRTPHWEVPVTTNRSIHSYIQLSIRRQLIGEPDT